MHHLAVKRPERKTLALALAAVLLGSLVVAACSSSPPRSSTNAATTTSTSPATTSTTTTVPATSTTQTTSAQANPGFTAAKNQWIGGASAISADQDSYWNQAASDLANAAPSAGSQSASYMMAVQELQQLASLPETSETPTQMTEAQQDTSALNSFFGTPGLY